MRVGGEACRSVTLRPALLLLDELLELAVLLGFAVVPLELDGHRLEAIGLEVGCQLAHQLCLGPKTTKPRVAPRYCPEVLIPSSLLPTLHVQVGRGTCQPCCIPLRPRRLRRPWLLAPKYVLGALEVLLRGEPPLVPRSVERKVRGGLLASPVAPAAVLTGRALDAVDDVPWR